MIKVAERLFVGAAEDCDERLGDEGWYVISAAKFPWHREALGYAGIAAPHDHPEYLIAKRPRHLILNLIDAADPAYIPDEILNAAITAIHTEIEDGKNVLVHCNQGLSRSPAIALLYLRKHDEAYAGLDYEAGVELFKQTYPDYAPGKGMEAKLKERWSE